MKKSLCFMDLETTGLHRGCDILGIGIKDADKPVFSIDYKDITEQKGFLFASHNEFQQFLDERTLVFHKASFDVRVLREHGYRVDDYHDTMVMAYCWDSTLNSYSLDSLTGGQKKHKDITDWSEWTPQIAERCESDVDLMAELFYKYQKLLDSDRKAKRHYMRVERPYIEVIMEMEATGFYVDSARVAKMDRLYSRNI